MLEQKSHLDPVLHLLSKENHSGDFIVGKKENRRRKKKEAVAQHNTSTSTQIALCPVLYDVLGTMNVPIFI